MTLFRIAATNANAASRTVQMAEQARDLGCTNVHTRYEPAHDGHSAAHVVNGTPPEIPDHPGQ